MKTVKITLFGFLTTIYTTKDDVNSLGRIVSDVYDTYETREEFMKYFKATYLKPNITYALPLNCSAAEFERLSK